MRGASSAPTARVVDVIELLSRPGHNQLRFSDVVRELHLTQATAHAILKTLTDRGWISRDPLTKTFSLGPALSLVAARLDTARPLTRAAQRAARRLADKTAMPASVIERVEDELMITAFEAPDDSLAVGGPNERIPYAPPFGVAFAAWDTDAAQQAWIRRGATADPALIRRLQDVLAATRERGYDIDWMTPALAQAAHVIGTLPHDVVPANLRPLIDQLLVEFTSAGPDFVNDTAGLARPIATISAPVLDDAQRIQLVLAIHPLRPMATREIRAESQALLDEIRNVATSSVSSQVVRQTTRQRTRGRS